MTTRLAAALAALLAATAALAQSDGGSGAPGDDPMPGAEASDLTRPAAESTDPSAEPGEPVLAAGREVFVNLAEPQCAVCHTLADAGSAGEIGPDLDTLADLDAARVHAAVTQGVGVMPAYEGVLTPEQIDAVAAYVATVSEGAGS